MWRAVTKFATSPNVLKAMVASSSRPCTFAPLLHPSAISSRLIPQQQRVTFFSEAASSTTNTTTAGGESPSGAKDPPGDSNGHGQGQQRSVEELLKEVEELSEELGEMQDKYRRSLADTENLRRQSHKHVEDARHFAIQSFCKDLLEVADVLNLAISSIHGDEVEKMTSPGKTLFRGVVMTEEVMKKIFGKHGLEQIHPEGALFDPNLHEAVFEVPQSQAKHKPGHVAVVMSTGYTLKGRTIRPAKVGVVKTHPDE